MFWQVAMSILTLVGFFIAYAIGGPTATVECTLAFMVVAALIAVYTRAKAVILASVIFFAALFVPVIVAGVTVAVAPGVAHIISFALCAFLLALISALFACAPNADNMTWSVPSVAKSEGTTKSRVWARIVLQSCVLFAVMAGVVNGLIPSVWIVAIGLLGISFVLFEADSAIRRYRLRKRERCLMRESELRSRIETLSVDEECVQYRIAPDLDPRASAEDELIAVQEELVRLNAKLEPQKISN